MDFYPGAMAEYCIAWGDYVTEIPDETSFEAAAMADILGVAIHAAGRAPIRSGSDILCIGGGPAGVYTALMALRKGAKKAFILEKSAIAREIIRKFNSCESFDPGEKAWQDLMRTKRNGFSAIYDSVGASELFEALLPLLEPSGTYINMAVHNLPVSISPSLFGCERIITSASNALYNENKEAVSMIVRKEIEAGKIITHYATFDTFMDNFELLLKDPKEAFKVVLRLS
jgi:threonine dehydrogenase-like Zn-dependent dehydrogenase